MFFDDVIFPVNLSYGTSGGPEYSTNVVVYNRHEKRNLNWDKARYRFDAAYAIRTHDELDEVIAIFHVAQGRSHSFRARDALDYKSSGVDHNITPTDQIIGVGDGVTTQFQLKKMYVAGSQSKVRDITKPVDGSVVLAVDGIAKTSGYLVDYKSGLITFDVAPAVDEVITAGFEFHVAVRFDTDFLSQSIDDYNTGSVQIPLIEVYE